MGSATTIQLSFSCGIFVAEDEDDCNALAVVKNFVVWNAAIVMTEFLASVLHLEESNWNGGILAVFGCSNKARLYISSHGITLVWF